jgi:hypothetical protein
MNIYEWFASGNIALVSTTTAVVLLASAAFVALRKPSNDTRQPPSPPPPPPPSHQTSSVCDEGLRDVWADRMKKGVAPASLNHKSGANEMKPFGSSYYYAHNNPNTTGGYADGLRMEDFTMNQPRLLSGGVRGVSAVENPPENAPTPPSDSEDSMPERSPPRKPFLFINKYLWDDPGDSKGIATIRIDQLPKSTTETIEWKEASVVDVESHLKGDEALVVIVRTNGHVDYRLNIPKLHGKVKEVRTLVKEKRLLVRLYKKSKSKPWPYPYQK